MSGLAEVLADQRRQRLNQAPFCVGVMAIHAVAGWALLSVDAVRQAVIDVMPAMVVTIIEPEPESEPYIPPPPAVLQLQPVPLRVEAPTQLAIDTPVSTEVVAVVPAAPAAITSVDSVPRPVEVAQPPRTIPASAVEYIVMPKPAYPLYSRRARETGTVMLRVLISEQGMPLHVEVEKSCGYARLDAAAVAAMKEARFRPYSENGVPLAVWAPAPIVFEL